MEFLRNRPQPGVKERAMKLLRFLAKCYPEVATHVALPMVGADRLLSEGIRLTHEEVVAHSWSINGNEVFYLLSEVLTTDLKYFENSHGRITPAGWLALEESATASDPSLGFVAMWFHPSITPLYIQAIEPSIRDAGYNAERMDFVEHTDSITDRMLGDIRRAKFLVADLTEQRPNVYFEAGFAMALGKRVIFTVRDDQRKEIHFDIQQYSYITWKEDDYPALRKKLADRILGAMGRGPVREV